MGLRVFPLYLVVMVDGVIVLCRLPVLATSVQEQLDTGSKSSAEVPEGGAQHDKHHPLLIRLLCDEMGIKPEQIVDFELCLADASPPVCMYKPRTNAV
jgi:hypothetical protein